MHSYQLDDREMDKSFLNYIPVLCRISVHVYEQLQPDQVIIVLLSNGAKYKGKIVHVNLIPMKNIAIGEMEVVRVGR